MDDLRAQVLTARLEQLPNFCDVSRDCRHALASLAVPASRPAGIDVTQEGERSSGLFVILRGRVKMSRQTPGGNRALLALFGPGDLFGAVSALSGRSASATMTTVEHTELLEIDRADLQHLLSARSELLGELLPLLSSQLVECRNCLVEAVASRLEVRFAHLFQKLAETIGREDGSEGGTFVPVPLSRQDLADMTGTTLESSIRIMSRWGKEGIVETRKAGFLVRQLGTLAAITGRPLESGSKRFLRDGAGV